MDALTGQTIKGYAIQDLIGQGAFGVVYRAYQSVVDREVAIKVILPQYANQPDFVRRFETEAQMVAHLEHIHIVPLYDYWRDPSGAYLVMRYLRGGNLRDWLADGPLSPEQALRIIEQVARALDLAHHHAIIHRDIKPTNVLLDEEHNAFLTDFGLAKVIGHESSREGLLGTPEYISPEQVQGQAVSPQSDLYSLGLVLYEMLVGRPAFRPTNMAEMVDLHLKTSVPAITDPREDLPDTINDVIQTATAKAPADRYADALALARALRKAMAITPTAKIEPVAPLIEPLTDRELDVLRLMAQGLSNREIAEQLVIALSTVKWYVRQIYGKLGVSKRRQALVAAQHLHLLDAAPGAAVPPDLALPEWMVGENPYKGLEAFQQADAANFFGREALVEHLVTCLHGDGDLNRFLAVVGPSGSGKSSVVRAGLLPALANGAVPGSGDWFVVDMLPGARPLDELTIRLVQNAIRPVPDLMVELQRDVHGLTRAARMTLPEDGDLLLVIDQFEELFTLVENLAVARHFLSLIHAAVTDPRSNVHVIITLRADFLDRPLIYPHFGELLRWRTELITSMNPEELEAVIVRPAENAGVVIESSLISTLVAEVSEQPGTLPLLEYTLTELFERREGRTMTLAAYHDVGGALGALAQRADDLFADLAGTERDAARQLFLRVVTLGEGTEDVRRRVLRTELVAVDVERTVMEDVIDVFGEDRLLTFDIDPTTREPTVEIAHEALIQRWERLRDWLAASRAHVRLQRMLGTAAKDWREANRDTDFLLRGSRLAQFEEWVAQTDIALTDEERALLEASLAEETRRRAWRRRTRILAFAALSVVAAVLGVLALWANTQRSHAETAEQEARQQASIGFAAQAMLELDGKFPDRAVPLALEALEDYPYTWQAEQALGQAVLTNRLQLELRGHSAAISHVLWSPDGSLLASMSIDWEMIIWNATTGELQHRIPTDQSRIFSIDWSSSGDRIVTADRAGVAKVWDVLTGEDVLTLAGHENAIYFARWSPDGSRIITSSLDTTAIIWDAVTGESLQTFVYDDMVGGVAWSPQGDQVLVSDVTGRVIIWDAATGSNVMALEGHESWLNQVRWSSASNHILSASDEGSAIMWDAETGEMLLKLAGHKDWVLDAQWSPDESTIVTYSRDGTTRIWDAVTGDERFVFSPGDPLILNSSSPLLPLAFSPSDERFAIIRFDGSFSVLNSSKGYIDFTLPGHAGLIISIDWSQSDRLATGAEDGTVRIWDMAPRLRTLKGHISLSFDVDWSPDDAWIASSGEDGTVRIWDATTGKEQDVFPAHVGQNSIIRWAPDSRRVAVNESEQVIQVIDTVTRDVLATFEEHQTSINDFAWSPAGDKIASVDGGGTVWVWDSMTGKPLIKYEGHQDRYITCIDWSPNSALIVSADVEGEAHIWDAATGELQQILPAGYGVVSRARWSPDGSMIATHTDDNIGGRIWDVENGEILVTFKGHTATVWGMDWASSGDRLVTTSMDGHVKVWDAHAGIELMQFAFPIILGNAAWSPDDQQIVFGGDDGLIRILALPWQTTQELIDYANECCVTRELTPEERVQFGLPPREE